MTSVLNLRVDAPDVNVVWETDGSTKKDFFINQPGIYTARISDPGCSYTDTIVVEPANCNECKVYIPNAFTPNGDGDNDVFLVFPEQAPIADDLICRFRSFKLNIFDRWGQKVFQADSPRVGWDGTNSDNDRLASGVYSYTIEYEYEHLRETQTLNKRGTIMFSALMYCAIKCLSKYSGRYALLLLLFTYTAMAFAQKVSSNAFQLTLDAMLSHSVNELSVGQLKQMKPAWLLDTRSPRNSG
ncbi:MAG: gliding motility-associated C-terminal domain-containing protein [Owenweeksia sp.]|nr:gliding motility-associated C-terminal domain-containing protein [Owenweeksia sp.]